MTRAQNIFHVVLLASSLMFPRALAEQDPIEEGVRRTVEKTYIEILGRSPDPEGMLTYATFLQEGGKDEIWLRDVLSNSREAHQAREARRQERKRLRNLRLKWSFGLASALAGLLLCARLPRWLQYFDIQPISNSPAKTEKSAKTNQTMLGFTSVFLMVGIGLVFFTFLRSIQYPMTHDESLSYAIWNWDPDRVQTANHHPLNTLLMQGMERVFGPGELSMRLPNILSLLAYLFATYKLASNISCLALRSALTVSLLSNLFILDFFSVARGYGLAMGFATLSLWMLSLFFKKHLQSIASRELLLSLVFGALAVWANYAFLNFFLSLNLVILLLVIRTIGRKPLPRSISLILLSIGFINLGFVALVARRLFSLKKTGELYFGGDEGFYSDTLDSLVHAWLYNAPYSSFWTELLKGSITGTFFLLVLGVVIQSFFKRKISLPTLYTLLLVLTVAAPIAQSKLFAAKFPVERAALVYMILFPLAVFQGVHELTKRRGGTAGVVRAISMIWILSLVSHFLMNASIYNNYSWPYDSKNKDVLVYLDHEWNATEGSTPLSFTSHWLFEPSFNYYWALAYKNTFPKLDRRPWRELSPDYVYTFTWDIDETDLQTYTEVLRFPEINTVLLKHRSDMDMRAPDMP